MSLPDEKLRSLIYAKRFLISLLHPYYTKRIPRQIRETASSVLRHYPFHYELCEFFKEQLNVKEYNHYCNLSDICEPLVWHPNRMWPKDSVSVSDNSGRSDHASTGRNKNRRKKQLANNSGDSRGGVKCVRHRKRKH